jgi:uncharacterized Rossmann fold enzyme
MWILPTRARPHNLERFFRLYAETGASQWGIVYVDDDDPRLAEYRQITLPDGWRMVISPRIGLGATINKAFTDNPHEPFYGMITDDSIPVTPKWDVLLSEAAGSQYIAYCSNETNKFGHCCLGGDLVRELGWIILPGLQRLYGEDVLLDVGRKRKCLRHVDVLIDHWHFSIGKAPMDETYEKPDTSNDRKIYHAWRKDNAEKITVCCVNWRNYLGRGAEYVNTLHTMVKTYLSLPHRFVCFTDDPIGLNEGIEVEALPVNLEGWMNKLYLFKRGVFTEGRVLFLDLDTTLCGRIDKIAQYDGEFAMLRDFYRPDGYGSGLMAWQAGFGSEIWERYETAGFPIVQGGDQAFIDQVFEKTDYKPDVLQDLFPGQIVSYKVHCTMEVPVDANIVCFHGNPRPHEVQLKMPQRELAVDMFNRKLNTDAEVMLAQARENMKRDLPWFSGGAEKSEAMLLVGGGPSLAESLPKLIAHKEAGGKIFAMNGTHDWLIERGIVPDYHVMLDSRQSNVCFVKKPHPQVKYLISAFCHPDVFEALKGFDVTLWFSEMDGIMPLVKGSGKQVCLIGGGSTVGCKAIYLGYIDGFRKFHFYGFDSSYRGEQNHAYPQPMNDGEQIIEVTCAGRTFKCATWMAMQAKYWQSQIKVLIAKGCEIFVHGDGLIAFMAQQMSIGDSKWKV